jgi:hypothetical protein
LGCHLALAAGPAPAGATSPAPVPITPPNAQPASSPPYLGTSDLALPSSPTYPVALPVNPPSAPSGNGSASGTAPDWRNYFSFSASLREAYDTNVTTTQNSTSSYDTTVDASTLFTYPLDAGSFSASYTISGSYYIYTSGNGGNDNNLQRFDLTHHFVANFTHAYNNRFNLNAADEFAYSTEPNLFESTGTVYRNGNYLLNNFNAGLSAQWTPLFGTSTSYNNIVVRYDDSPVAAVQDSVENSASQTFSLTVLPTVSAVTSASIDEIDFSNGRGYINSGATVGASWQATSAISTNANVGASYIVFSAGNQSAQFAPTANLGATWQIGGRTAASVSYSHAFTPTDNSNANAQQSDRFSGTVSYQFNPRLGLSFQGIYTHSTISRAYLIGPGQGYDETDAAASLNLSYNLNSNLSFNLFSSIADISTGLADQSYDRTQVGVGIRGSY